MEPSKKKKKPIELTSHGLWVWGMVFCAFGIAGGTISQALLKDAGVSGTGLLELMEQSSEFLSLTSAAMVCQIICACAAPVFAFLLVEGVLHSSNIWRYLARVFLAAIISEAPYNMVFSGSPLNLASRNPVFGVLISLLALCFYRRFAGKRAIQILVTAAAFIWVLILRVDDGFAVLLLTVVLWAFREKTLLRSLAGCVASFGCCVFSPFYIVSPLALIVIHFYNGKRGSVNPRVRLLCYPALLLIGLVLVLF